MKLREMMQWLLKLLPKQKMHDTGHGNVQAGQVGGDLHHTHAVYNIYMVSSEAPKQAASSGPEATQDELRPDVISPALAPALEATAQPNRPDSQQHSATLARMDLLQYRARITVLEFMSREFKTKLVIELQTEELFRLNRYLDRVLSNPRARKRKQVA